MPEDLQGGAVKYLQNIPEVVNAVGKFTITQKPFIFRDENLVNLESGEYQAISAIVIEDAGPYAALSLSRFRGRRLRLTIWANGTRDASGILVDTRSVRWKINDTFKTVDKYMNRTSPETVYWADILTFSCERIIDLSEPVAISDGDGILIASSYYAVYY
jgi:hypothetical protein